MVGASLEVMREDSIRMRGKLPFVFTNLKSGHGVMEVANFIVTMGFLKARGPFDKSVRLVG
jgi:urease accessory protein